VILICRKIPLDNKFHVLFGDAGLHKRDVFGDSVILAIAATRQKRLERRTPVVGHPPLGEITDWPYRQIDSPVDHTNAGAAIAGTTFIYDRKKTLRCRRTAFRVLTAMRQNLNVAANVDPDLPPLGWEFARGNWCSVKAEGLGSILDKKRWNGGVNECNTLFCTVLHRRVIAHGYSSMWRS
jgi:hypothetical protein